MATTTNFGWETPDDTDLVKDGALAMRTLGNAIDASLVDLKGGTTGQVLSKTSNTDMDFTWVTSDDANAIQNAIVDAKGDLITATAADTPARLAVGSNGDTLVADSAQSTGLRYNPPVASLSNPVVNGGMDIWQRGTSFATGSLNYAADRWQTARSGQVAGLTTSRQNVSDSTNLPNIQYAIRLQRDSGNTSTNDLVIGQSFETVNSIPFAGKTVTVSFYARKGANYSPTTSGVDFLLRSGTGTDQNGLSGALTGSTNVISQNATLTTTWQRFAYTGNIPATATQLYIQFGSGALVGTAGTNDWFEFTGVQIDVGTWTASTAPTFRRSGGTLQGEIALAQRYYQKSYDLGTAPATTTELGQMVIDFPSARATRFGIRWNPMRVSPTVTTYSPITGATGRIYNDLGSDLVLNGPYQIGQNGGFVDVTASGNWGRFHFVASAEL